MDKGLVRIHADRLERAAWTLVFLSIFSLSLNPYDTAIGFWGVFCAYSKHGRATFGCINCVIFSLLFDLIIYNLIRNSLYYRKSWRLTFFKVIGSLETTTSATINNHFLTFSPSAGTFVVVCITFSKVSRHSVLGFL